MPARGSAFPDISESMLKRFVAGTVSVLLLHGVALAQTSSVTATTPSSPPGTPPADQASQVTVSPTAGMDMTTPIADYEKARRDSVVRAVKIDTPITIDGRLDEPAWALAAPATRFIQVQPHHGLSATEQTAVRILYDEDNLYVGAMCYDSQPKSIRISSLQKDFSSNNTDLFAMVLDTLNDAATRWAAPARTSGRG